MELSVVMLLSCASHQVYLAPNVFIPVENGSCLCGLAMLLWIMTCLGDLRNTIMCCQATFSLHCKARGTVIEEEADEDSDPDTEPQLQIISLGTGRVALVVFVQALNFSIQ